MIANQHYFCRWNSDCYQSDVCCSKVSEEFYTTDVAAWRYVNNKPPPQNRGSASNHPFDEFFRQRRYWIAESHLEPIGLPYDGMSFIDTTIENLLLRALALRDLGYRVPPSAINDMLRESFGEHSWPPTSPAFGGT